MKPFLLPLRMVMGAARVLPVFLMLAMLVGVGLGVYNYTRPASRVAYDNLARGTVRVQTGSAEGTGAIVQDGGTWDVITASHVLAGSNSARIMDRQGRSQMAPVVWTDTQRDVAELRVRPMDGWVAVPLDRGTPKPSDRVLTLCFFDQQAREGPLLGPVDVNRVGGEQVQTKLDVSGLLGVFGGLVTTSRDNVMALMPVQPGCSGAPMVNSSGHIVGFVLAGNSRETIAITAGKALPKN